MGKLNSGAHTAANSDELATEPLGYDDNDMDDFNTGTTGPTITQTDINPDNAYSGSKRLGQWTGSIDSLTSAIQNALSDDLRKSQYQGDPNPLTGHCYVASEAAYHLLGGKAAGWKPMFFNQGSHWWLENQDGRRVDVTAGQFPGPYPYENGSGKGFLTAQPSKRAQVVIDRVLNHKTASWTDVQAKAKRIRSEGGIRIISVTGPYVTAHVQGDDGVYETSLERGKSGSIDQWTCSCPWFAYSFGRSGRWKKYEGRMCSHALALQYQAQSEGMFGKDIKEQSTAPDWDDKVTYYEAPPPKDWQASKLRTAKLTPSEKDAIHLWSTIKVNNQEATPNPEHDGFRYAFHQIMGDAELFQRDNYDDPDFIRGESLAVTFLDAFMAYAVDTHKPIYRAIGLDHDKYMAMLAEMDDRSIDLPPSSWSIDKKLTEQFGLTGHGGKVYDDRIIFVAAPGTKSWALGRTSKTGYEREHIVGGRFRVLSIEFPVTGNTTIVKLQQEEAWPEDFASSADTIDHMVFDQQVASPQDGTAGTTAAARNPLASYEKEAAAPLSTQYIQTGKPTQEDFDALMANYISAHGKPPPQKDIDKLRAKVTTLGESQEPPTMPASDSAGEWPSTPEDQDEPSSSPIDSTDVNTVLPGAQATLDDEPEGALPFTDGESGQDITQSDQDYYPTDEQQNTKPYGGEGAAPSTIAWLNPANSNKGVRAGDMDIAKAAKDYLMTSEAVKTFTYAEQQEIINEGEGVTAANLDRLRLEGTHYEQLEEQIARAEAVGEPIIWL